MGHLSTHVLDSAHGCPAAGGAGGTIDGLDVLRAATDGHTLVLSNS